MRLSELVRAIGGELVGSDAEIERVAKIEDAAAGEITFLANPKYKKHLATTAASAVLIAADAEFEELRRRTTPLAVVRVRDPYRAFLTLIDRFHPPLPPLPRGIHPTAVVAGSAVIHPDAALGACVVIGDHCRIGAGTAIYPGTVLGESVEIGAGSTLYANVTVREQCILGDRVIIHSGAVIGSDGFGFAPTEEGTYEKIPQRGRVVIEDDVEIGANCAIDRATIGETRVMRGAKLDNLVQIAHNVVVGAHTVIAAQTGISGSTRLGEHCALGGQVGLTGHITIADHTTIGAQSGVPKSITVPGKTYMGYPAREIRTTWRIDAALAQLPELLDEVRRLEQRLKELEDRLSSTH
jgi:UDP-3-O-[3-hydroxymyristoyl] glucosamine N-acyltransferase